MPFDYTDAPPARVRLDSGWHGRGLWFTNRLDPMIHSELPQSFVGHVQVRPNPLAH